MRVFRWGEIDKSVSSKAFPTYLMKRARFEEEMMGNVSVSMEQEVGKCVLLKLIGKFNRGA